GLYNKDQHITTYDDFEQGLGRWIVDAEAFKELYVEQDGGAGKVNRFIHSGAKGDSVVGEMRSAEFTIRDKFIVFKLGGGRHATKTAFNLIVDGQTVRTETGNNTDTLADKFWDVRDLVGKKAYFEVIDQQKGRW